MVIIVDLVPMFPVGFPEQHDHVWLREEIVKNLLENKPLGWNSYMFKFLSNDRFFIHQVNLASETDKLYVGMKMLTHQGNFTLRPGLNMFVEKMMNNSTLKNVYIFLKLFKLMSQAKVKSFGLKKVLSDCLLEKSKEINDWELMKAVLEHHEMKNKFTSIHSTLEEMGYAKVEVADYIKSEGDHTFIHCVTYEIIQLYDEMCKKNNDRVLELVQQANTLTHYSYEGNPPLCAAIKYGVNPQVSETMIEKCDVNKADYLHQTPLFLASESGLARLVEQLLTVSRREIDYLRKGDMATPILIACKNGHDDCVRSLIRHGAMLNAISIDGRTPLHHAARHGNLKSVRYLLLGSAIYLNRKRHGLNTPLHDAAKFGHTDIVTTLIFAGALMNEANDNGDTPLHVAANSGQENVVRCLIQAKAGLNVISSDGSTPLHYACQNGHVECVEELLNQGANANAKNTDGEAPIHVASSRGHVDCIQKLVNNRAIIAVSYTHLTLPTTPYV